MDAKRDRRGRGRSGFVVDLNIRGSLVRAAWRDESAGWRCLSLFSDEGKLFSIASAHYKQVKPASA